MSRLLILMFLIPNMLHASDMTMVIEKKAAELSACSIHKPCMISVREKEGKHIAKVTSSALISEYGVLKFLPGGVTHYIFDKNGLLIRTHRPP